ncbi:bifunctional DNA primase/polymerase [Streptomyces orinoci]|uniref:Bifunctional DNA primase/polymerase n=1 Tax=Streptomyces orinoci TaxID=67339 RepID=A0ABV3JPT5_STRON|nr:bifunctional DNA primase/polymerase [Streptomyces orinoci]
MTQHAPERRASTSQTRLLDAALRAARNRWHVHPLRPGQKSPALHGERTCPRTGECQDGHRKWEDRATTDPARIRRAWAAGPFNIGIATGPSNLLVVDLDVPKDKGSSDAPDGATSFKALCERADHRWPRTYTVRTPSGGLHLYFWVWLPERLPCTAGTLAPHIDTRAWGGNIVAAGSTTPEGTYTVVTDLPPASLPYWLLELLHTPPKPPATPAAPRLVAPGCATPRAKAALARETAEVEATAEGGRNARLLAGARAMGRFVAWGEVRRDQVELAFQAAGEAAGLSAAECRATIRSALDWSIRTCRPREAA